MSKMMLALCFAVALILTSAVATFGLSCTEEVAVGPDGFLVEVQTAPIENPDGSECCYSHTEEGPFGDRGVYECETADGEAYTGFGPPRGAR